MASRAELETRRSAHLELVVWRHEARWLEPRRNSALLQVQHVTVLLKCRWGLLFEEAISIPASLYGRLPRSMSQYLLDSEPQAIVLNYRNSLLSILVSIYWAVSKPLVESSRLVQTP